MSASRAERGRSVANGHRSNSDETSTHERGVSFAFSGPAFSTDSVYWISGCTTSRRAMARATWSPFSGMNRSELEKILTDLESDRVELTISLTDFDKFGEAICSFSNDLPNSGQAGYLFIGATPEGKASGAVIEDDFLQRLAAIRSDGHIQPLPAMNVQKWFLGGGEMAVVEVFPSDLPPVRYRGRTCIRVGPRRAPCQSRRGANTVRTASRSRGPGTLGSAGRLPSTTWLSIFSRSTTASMRWRQTS